MTLTPPFSLELQKKIDLLKGRRKAVQLGRVSFTGPLLLAPMSAITSSPYRLLMEDLGAGGTISELISCHGINYKGQKTLHMLGISPQEKNVGIQLFGEDPEAMAKAAKQVEELEIPPKFIDINMGCPVRKVVTKGAGSALLRTSDKLAIFFSTIRKAISLPLTVKIRTGWDEESINALEIAKIAHHEGLEFVSIHGRTSKQQYRGKANWDVIESVAQAAPLPIIGNGDLNVPGEILKRLSHTHCQALMLGRGPLRSPFLFLESYLTAEDKITFGPHDYLEILSRYRHYLESYTPFARVLETQIKKHAVWMVAGMPGASQFRSNVFACPNLVVLWGLIEQYFKGLQQQSEQNGAIFRQGLDDDFMQGGHG
ncbi:MAG: tRNA-dihydrouridine synthase [Bdellovibrio sp.]|nr:tRNA-dihydrouridine synthase [Bdellovibrio sp.]